MVSIVRLIAEEADDRLPDRSVAVAVKLFAPDKVPVVTDQLPDALVVVVPTTLLPLYSLIVDSASAVPETVGVVSFVMPGEVEINGAAGAWVSTVVMTATDAGELFPALSLAMADKLFAPVDKVLVVTDQLPDESAVVVATTLLPL